MSLSKSALNLIAYSEGLKLKGVLGRLVMRPDSVKKTIDNMLEGSDDVMRLILNDNKMAYTDFLKHRAEHCNDSAAQKELDYAQLRFSIMWVRLCEMNWHLRKIENEESRAEASTCLLALFNAAVPEMFGMRVSSPNARRYSQGQQAKTARAKRSQQPEEQALQRVIEAELCGRAVARPNKEAEAMFTRVNEALSQEGFAPVKKGVIRRRLEKKCPLFKNGHKVLPAL
jgi:hypothetical protein